MIEQFDNPERKDWPRLQQRAEQDLGVQQARVQSILRAVQTKGDCALWEFTEKFDGVKLSELCVSEAEISAAAENISRELQQAIQTAAKNIAAFHKAQTQSMSDVETMPGVRCRQKETPIERVGLYVPGGSAPLLSTVLMLAIPAKLAGCHEIVLCTPPRMDGTVAPEILYCAGLAGVQQVFKIGGAQAIAAMGFGTQTVPAVDKIFGPGNTWVTLAKQQLAASGMAIDMPAGPSEVVVLADDSARADFIAADLLSQAEHGPDSQALLVTTSKRVAVETSTELQKQLSNLPRRAIATKALSQSRIVVLTDLDTAMEFVNGYAPEHLILVTAENNRILNKVQNAGSVFVGPFTPEAAGDYASGTNHTLPTYGFARSWSGLTLSAFRKTITIQQISASGLQALGPAIEVMADAEQLQAHRRAVSLRLQVLREDS